MHIITGERRQIWKVGRAQNSDLQNHFFKLLGSTILHYFSFHPSRKKGTLHLHWGRTPQRWSGEDKSEFYSSFLLSIQNSSCHIKNRILSTDDWLVGGRRWPNHPVVRIRPPSLRRRRSRPPSSASSRRQRSNRLDPSLTAKMAVLRGRVWKRKIDTHN